MNEKSLGVTKQYDFEIIRVIRGRGGMILHTDDGVKLLLECRYAESYYDRESIITEAIVGNGYNNVDTFVKNCDEKVVTYNESDHKKYIIKNWFDGNECNVKSIDELSASVAALAKLHTAFDEVSLNIEKESVNSSENFIMQYLRHTKELKKAMNYLKKKKKRSSYELLMLKSIPYYYDEAIKAVNNLSKEKYTNRINQAIQNKELVHGAFNYHNVIISFGNVAITNFDKCRIDCQICDLYQFMRKILEKYNWSIEVAYKLINEYDKVRTITEVDLQLLGALFAFPEKYWKLINYYYNSNKAWIPPKSIEKLNVCMEQNYRRLDFLATIGALC